MSKLTKVLILYTAMLITTVFLTKVLISIVGDYVMTLLGISGLVALLIVDFACQLLMTKFTSL